MASVALGTRVGKIDPLSADRKSNTWHKVDFTPPFPANTNVVVIPMTQTYNGWEIPGLRLQNVNTDGFQIRFDELRSTAANSDGEHGDETVGWVAYAF